MPCVFVINDLCVLTWDLDTNVNRRMACVFVINDLCVLTLCRHNTVTQFKDNPSGDVNRWSDIMAKRENEGESDGGGDSRYNDELLCANWNPVIELLQWSCSRTAEQTRRSAPKDVSEEEAAAFLGRVYTLGI